MFNAVWVVPNREFHVQDGALLWLALAEASCSLRAQFRLGAGSLASRLRKLAQTLWASSLCVGLVPRLNVLRVPEEPFMTQLQRSHNLTLLIVTMPY